MPRVRFAGSIIKLQRFLRHSFLVMKQPLSQPHR